MQNPPGDGGRHPTSVGETLERGSPELPQNQTRWQEDSCNGRTHAGSGPLRAGLQEPDGESMCRFQTEPLT